MNPVKSYTLTLALLIFSALALTAVGPCQQDQGKRYSYDGISANAFDAAKESEYDSLLQKYVDNDSLIKYEKWTQNTADFQNLKNVIAAMGSADDSTMSLDAKKAFYINAYNALTIDLILSHYSETMGGNGSPLPGERSIRNISNLDSQVWDHFKWRVSGKQRSLNDIEHRILRPMGDARIHFAIVCASMGCPPIYRHAFSEGTLNQVLDELADSFVNSGKSTTFDKVNRIISTSHILNWFGQDFVNSFGSLKSFFSKYVEVIPAQEVESYSIKFHDYDWSLNESPPTGSGTEHEVPAPSPSPSPTPGGSGTEREIGG